MIILLIYFNRIYNQNDIFFLRSYLCAHVTALRHACITAGLLSNFLLGGETERAGLNFSSMYH